MRVWYAMILLVPACEVGSVDGDDEETDVAEEAVDGQVAHATQPYTTTGTPSPSSDFNGKGMHNDQCVNLKGIAALRYADGSPTGYVLDPSKLKFNDARRPVDDSRHKPCPDVPVQLEVAVHLFPVAPP